MHFEEPEQALSAAKSRKNTSAADGKERSFLKHPKAN